MKENNKKIDYRYVNEIPAITVSYTKSTFDFIHESFEYRVKGESVKECLKAIDELIKKVDKKK